MAHGGRRFSMNEQMHCEFSASREQFQSVNDIRSISAREVQISEPTNEIRLRQTPTDTENKYFQKVGFQSMNKDGIKVSEVQITEIAKERLRQTPVLTDHTEKEMHCEFSASREQFQSVNDNRSISAREVQISEPTNEIRLRQTPTDTENKYFQKVGFQSMNKDGSKASEVQITEIANERLRQTPVLTDHTEKEATIELKETLLKLSPNIGLTLTEIDSFLDLVERKIFHANNISRCDAVQRWVEAEASNDIVEKLKASNFCASFLRIGSWEEVSKCEGALVAKCYYAKRKLVWEIMKDGLKSKIEIQWSNILAIGASIAEGQPGILEIELNTPPMFYQEIDPMPRKHTIWKTTSDFTDGQALIHRGHYIEFPAGNLDKHLDKLLHCDSRMSMLSTRPFPSLSSPYFHSGFYNETREFSLYYNGDGLNINSSYQLPYFSSTPAPLALVQQVQAYEQTNQPYFPANDSFFVSNPSF